LEGGKRDAFDPGGPGFVDKDELFRVEIELGLKPSLTAFQDIRPILLGCMRGLFLSVTRLRAKKRDSAEMLNEWPAAAKAACISASVASPSGPSRERMKSAWASIAFDRRSPPWRLGLMSPVVSDRAIHRIALEAPTLKCAAA
jgi:hypothetical protein